MNALGLGGYGSEDEQEDEQEGQLLRGASTEEDDQEAAGVAVAAASARPDAPTPASDFEGQQLSEPGSAGASGQNGARDEDAMVTGEPGAPRAGSALQVAALQGLPPELQQELPGEPPPDVVAKCEKMVLMKREARRVFNDSLRSHKGYRNPDLLTKLVEHSGVDQYGSAFDKDVFDPKGMPEEDKLQGLQAQLEREQERKKAARESASMRPEALRAGAGVEFTRGGVVLPSTSGGGAGAGGASGPGGLVNTAMMRQQAALQAALAINQAAVKRSKWDTSGQQ